MTCSLCAIGVTCDRAGGGGPRRHAVWPAWQDSTDLSLEFRGVATDSLLVNFSKGQCLVFTPDINIYVITTRYQSEKYKNVQML